MPRGMISVDGSYLFGSIGRLQKDAIISEKALVDIHKLSLHLINSWSQYIDEVVRVSYYFKKNDKRKESMLLIPELDKTGAKSHWNIVECGEPLKTIPQSELDKLSPKWRDTYARAEKGLDMRIACDALSLAATGRINDFVFMINDRDYLPLLEAIQRFGCCTYVTSMDTNAPQAKLLEKCDYYIDLKDKLKTFINESE